MPIPGSLGPWSSLRLISAFCLLGLTGCLTAQSDRALQYKSALKGKTKQEVISCAGVPIREYKSGELTFLTYGLETGGVVGARGNIVGVMHQCEATVHFSGDIVDNVQYRSTRKYFAEYAVCEEIFEACAKGR